MCVCVCVCVSLTCMFVDVVMRIWKKEVRGECAVARRQAGRRVSRAVKRASPTAIAPLPNPFTHTRSARTCTCAQCHIDRISNPDNVMYVGSGVDVLFIAEDSSGHETNVMWQYDVSVCVYMCMC